LKVDFEKAMSDAERDDVDTDYIAEHHSYSKVQEKFGSGFQFWFSYLESSVFLQAGGYPFGRDDFTEYEWQAMGIISNFNKARQNNGN
jgi:hypothetical protein